MTIKDQVFTAVRGIVKDFLFRTYGNQDLVDGYMLQLRGAEGISLFLMSDEASCLQFEGRYESIEQLANPRTPKLMLEYDINVGEAIKAALVSIFREHLDNDDFEEVHERLSGTQFLSIRVMRNNLHLDMQRPIDNVTFSNGKMRIGFDNIEKAVQEITA